MRVRNGTLNAVSLTMLMFAGCSQSAIASVPESVVASIDGLQPGDGTIYQVQGGGFYLVPAYSTAQQVAIMGIGQFDEIHQMSLFLGGTQVDEDTGSGRVSTGEDNIWVRQAHGNGQLYGERLLAAGTWSVKAAGQIAASRVPNGQNLFHSTSLLWWFTIQAL